MSNDLTIDILRKEVERNKKSALRSIAQNSFLSFCMVVQPDFVRTRVHTYLALQLEKMYRDVVAGRSSRLTIEIQPQIGKSTMTSVLFTAWVLGRESWPIIVASYGSDLAETQSQKCRDIITSNNYKLVFPHVNLHPDSTSKTFWRTTTGGSYRAAGVGSALTGMSGKILICDDPIKDWSEAKSALTRDTAWSWWQTVLTTRKQAVSGICLVNTRWHKDDVSGRLEEQEKRNIELHIPEGQFDRWQRLRFAAIATEDEELDGVTFRKKGEALCPERFPLQAMLTTKNAMSPMEWQALYQQNPISQETAKFKVEWFKYWNTDQVYTNYQMRQMVNDLDVYVMVDPAISEKVKADNTSIQVIAKAPSRPDIFWLEEDTGKLDPSEIIDKLFNLRIKYGLRLRRIGIESVAYQKALLHFFQKEMIRRDLYVNVVELKASKGSKVHRIEGLIPYYKNGHVWHVVGTSSDLEAELMEFPSGKHDDRIDALAYFDQLVKHAEGRVEAKQYIPHMKRYGSRT